MRQGGEQDHKRIDSRNGHGCRETNAQKESAMVQQQNLIVDKKLTVICNNISYKDECTRMQLGYFYATTESKNSVKIVQKWKEFIGFGDKMEAKDKWLILNPYQTYPTHGLCRKEFSTGDLNYLF